MGKSNTLQPRDGHTLRVVAVCRISTVHQDVRSLDDQMHRIREVVGGMTTATIEWKTIATQASGELLDRAELVELHQLVESRTIDLVIAEDLARFCRRHHAISICEHCEDHGVRLVAINDRIDTANDRWRDLAMMASWHHERSNQDTSDRLRRSIRSRFESGGVIQFTVFGYVKPIGSKSDADLRKDPVAEPIIERMVSMLEGGATYAEVSRWLNSEHVPVGPFCRLKEWNHKMVSRLIHNEILKGVRVRNKKKSVRNNATGRHVSRDAPIEERLERYCPHLQFIDTARYDALIRMLDLRNAKSSRASKKGGDSRRGVSRSQTTWPAQHLCCGVCGRRLRRGGHGRGKMLLCSGSAEYRCWDSATIDCLVAGPKILAAILDWIEQLPEFDELFGAKVAQELRDQSQDRKRRRDAVRSELSEIDGRIRRVTEAIAAVGLSEALKDQLVTLEADKRSKLVELDEIERMVSAEQVNLPSMVELKAKSRAMLGQPGVLEDPVIHRSLQAMIRDFHAYPFRLADGQGPTVHRAGFILDLTSLLSQVCPTFSGNSNLRDSVLRIPMVVDLFDAPQRVVHREAIVALRAQGLTLRAAGQRVGITMPAAQNAVKLQAIMDEQGLTDPYVPLTEPRSDGKYHRRHLHPGYRFEPLEGWTPPNFDLQSGNKPSQGLNGPLPESA